MADAAVATERPNPKARQIIEAAGRVFMEQGYGATSMDAVAREAGVSKATLYAHFSSKERLFAEMIAARCLAHSEMLARATVDVADIRAALRQFGREFLDIVLSPDGLAVYRVVIAETPRFPELGRAFYEAGPRMVYNHLEEFFRRATERGLLAVADTHLAASQFIGMIRGDMYLRRQLGVDEGAAEDDADRTLDGAVEAILKAYAPA